MRQEGAVASVGGTRAKTEVSSGAGGAGEHLCCQDRSREKQQRMQALGRHVKVDHEAVSAGDTPGNGGECSDWEDYPTGTDQMYHSSMVDA